MSNNFTLACRRLEAFFGFDREKIEKWWNTPNPMFGGLSPHDLYLEGREDKLAKIIHQQLDENERTEC